MADNNNMVEKLKAFLETDEGKASIKKFKAEIEAENRISNSQLERFHEKFSDRFTEIVDKVIAKYESDKYQDSWYKRSIEPPMPLYWFLKEYAELHGRECTDKEWEKHGNMFSGSLYFYGGYYFHTMHGQGSVIHVIKEKE